ncbi:MAG: hypothetical protein ABEJ61_01960 [Haloferacaceae archaeon]
MSTTTLCQICGSAPATHACERCGAAVCEEHYDEDLGLCVDCAAEVRGRDGADDVGPGGDVL